MDFDSTGKLIQISLAYKVMPIFEFAALFFVVFIAYFAVHNVFERWHQLVKFSLAVFLGSLGYIAGKIALIALFMNPLLASQPAHVFF